MISSADFFPKLRYFFVGKPAISEVFDFSECENWAMFQHANMDDLRVKDLLAAMLDDAALVRKRSKPSERFKSNRLERWELLTTELRRRNRYFPEIEIDFSRLADLLEFLRAQIWKTTGIARE
jgi:hypothetical protein